MNNLWRGIYDVKKIISITLSAFYLKLFMYYTIHQQRNKLFSFFLTLSLSIQHVSATIVDKRENRSQGIIIVKFWALKRFPLCFWISLSLLFIFRVYWDFLFMHMFSYLSKCMKKFQSFHMQLPIIYVLHNFIVFYRSYSKSDSGGN
jgi:hypothetical protein